MAPRIVVLSLALLTGCIQSQDRAEPDSTSSPTDTSEPADTFEPDVDTRPTCAFAGDQRCSVDRQAIEVCGEDLHWSSTGCSDSRVCIDYPSPACVPPNGEQSCRELLFCFLGCYAGADDQEACGASCYVRGTTEAQRHLENVQECMGDADCTDLDLKPSLECASTNCDTDLGLCYFPEHGDKSCGQIVACSEACNDDFECVQACGNKAVISEQGEFAVLELCIFFACVGQDEGCVERETTTGVCKDFVADCIAPATNN